jgi:hypothetical protein
VSRGLEGEPVVSRPNDWHDLRLAKVSPSIMRPAIAVSRGLEGEAAPNRPNDCLHQRLAEVSPSKPPKR